jgi:hypothetical protein
VTDHQINAFFQKEAMAMATRRSGKSKTSSKSKAKAGKRSSPASAQLRKLIEELIDAKQRGDLTARDKAVAALAAFHKGTGAAEVRQAAAEAQAVAGHAVMVDSLRLLGDIAARLRPAA